MKAVVTGSAGMLGTSISEAWARIRPGDQLIPVDKADIDLRDRDAVRELLVRVRPDSIIHVAALVGGVGDRIEHPTRYLLDNLLIDTSVISGAMAAGVSEMVYVSSAGIYPAVTDQPISEGALMTGPLEGEMEPYALAKIAGTRLCRYASAEFGLHYRAMVPSNMYGPGEDPALDRAQLATAALRKMYDARKTGASEVVVWGDGSAMRELTFVRDVAEWIALRTGQLAEWPELMNLGSGEEVTVREVYETARDVSGADVELRFDATKPVGVKRRLLDSEKARQLGWAPHTPFIEGMRECFAALEARLGA